MPWVDIPGYRWPYRINEEACVQKQLPNGDWSTLSAYISGRTRAAVKMRTTDNRKVDVPVVWLMADAFMGGRKPGFAIVHKNKAKLDCSLNNLSVVPIGECGKISCRSRRKPVEKVDRAGNVVAIYPSARAAAEQNHMSQTAMWHRCRKKIKNPFALDGFNYRYE